MATTTNKVNTNTNTNKKPMKYIVVTGGVVSGLGKGITISSMGKLLQACGLRVTAIKIDPYLNVDAGTMSPFEHGEVFVLNDGGESDLDLGNYERFLGITLTQDHNITTGKVYGKVIAKERKGDYLGKTVQVVPHITDEIQHWIQRVAHIPVDDSGEIADICLVEVGGTVGDIESSVFLEALRQFQFQVGYSNFCLCFLSLVPVMSEQKTKPTQHGVKDLRSLGLSPSVIVCRATEPLHLSTMEKISNFCHVPPECVLSVHDVHNVYQVPILLQQQGLHTILNSQLKLMTDNMEPNLGAWQDMAQSLEHYDKKVTIALIGKYTGLQDSYLSVIKALKHSCIACKIQLDLHWVEAAHLEQDSIPTNGESKEDQYSNAWEIVKNCQGMVIPGGFGDRGFQGKVLAAEYARIHKIPCLGVCLGFQAMVIEYARNILKWDDAHSTELNETTSHPVIMFMPEVDPTTMGGTMRLGTRLTHFVVGKNSHAASSTSTSSSADDNSSGVSPSPTSVTAGVNNHHPDFHSQLQLLYHNATKINERHRHRYEVNPEFVTQIEDAGLIFCGKDETETRMEICELSEDIHPYYVGTQFHPEFKSRPLQPSPPFLGLIQKACGIPIKAMMPPPASVTSAMGSSVMKSSSSNNGNSSSDEKKQE